MSRFWSERVRNTTPYAYGEQPKGMKYIKLNTNENPFPPSPKSIERMKAAINKDLKLYPDPTCNELKDEIAEFCGVDSNQVFVGNGSDEVLAFSFLAFFNKGDRVLFPDITYSFYEVYANFFEVDFEMIPLNEDFTFPVEKFMDRDAAVLISNPNAPTGMCLSLDGIERIAESNSNRIIVVDEAYIDFGGTSAIDLIKKHDNILVSQTLSKSRSLAGIRVGYAIGSKEVIEGLERVKNSINSYTVDTVALAGAIEAIKDKSYFDSTRKDIIATRNRTVERLGNIGFNILESKANFIFITHEKIAAKELYDNLREVGILVRYFNKPRINNYLRVSIGSDVEMDVFCEKLEKIVTITI